MSILVFDNYSRATIKQKTSINFLLKQMDNLDISFQKVILKHFLTFKKNQQLTKVSAESKRFA